MTGTEVASAANLADPSIGVRMTITSLYRSAILAVSQIVSPFLTEETFSSENPMTLPPNRHMALSKLNLVRVEGSKNKVANIFPESNVGLSFSMALEIFKTWSRSFLEKSRIETMSRPLNVMVNPF
jgi:hypothetical protein